MLHYVQELQTIVILVALMIILFLCVLTDLQSVLGINFSKKEIIEKYIKKNIIQKKENEKSICTFKLISTKNYSTFEEVYILMCICVYTKKDKKYIIKDEFYKNGVVKISRKFGVYKVLSLDMIEDTNDFLNNDEFRECMGIKEKNFLKESNYIKANKKLRIKKVFKI